MRSFSGSITDGVLFKFLPVHQYRGRRKIWKVNEKEEMLGWLTASLNITETKDEL